MAAVSLARYLAGFGSTIVIGGAHVWVGWRVRRVLVPNATGAASIVATAIIALTSLITTGQLLGAVGLLAWWPVVLLSLGVAALIGWSTRGVSMSRTSGHRESPRSASAWIEWTLVTGCVAAVAWQWTTHLADAYGRGMVQPDNLWYHGPFAARFLQTGDFGDLGSLGYAEARALPLNSELLNALTALPFSNDLLVPLTAHIFGALALASAYSIGARWRCGGIAVLGVTVMMSLPLVGSTQPGQMYNDVIAAALVLASVALLVEADLRPGALAASGMALGLAISTKLSLVGVALPLAIGVLTVAIIRRRPAAALSWCAALLLTGTFWFWRNWTVYGSPVPYLDVELGPISWPARIESETGGSLWSTLSEFGEWRAFYAESIDTSFGPLWFVVLAMAVVGCVAVIARSRDWRALAALSALIGLASFPFLPLTGELPFVNNLRYAVPALALASVMPALAVASNPVGRIGISLIGAASIVANLASAHRGRVPAWPGYHAWGAAVTAGFVVTAIAFARRDVLRAAFAGLRPIRARASLAAVVLLATVGAGWILRGHYLDRRYTSGHPESVVHEQFVHVRGSFVDAVGTIESYPMFGPDLSNEVTVHLDEFEIDGVPPEQPCRYWRRSVKDGPGYIVVIDPLFRRPIEARERQRWFADDPAVTVLVDEEGRSVYFHDRALDPGAC